MYPKHTKKTRTHVVDTERIVPRTYDDVGNLNTNEDFHIDRNES